LTIFDADISYRADFEGTRDKERTITGKVALPPSSAEFATPPFYIVVCDYHSSSSKATIYYKSRKRYYFGIPGET